MVETLQPDILIQDLMMPLLNGLHVALLLTGKSFAQVL
jgi:YesN/AraC family two-component response regulator